MKLAIAGKGGSGKTSIAGTMARIYARNGNSVLAIDGDTNPNLALTLGITAEQMNSVPTIPRGLMERTEDGVKLTQSLEEVRRAHSVDGPDGVTLLVMAHAGPEDAGTGCFCGMHATVRTLIESASDADSDVLVLDTEASPEHLTRGTVKHTETMLTVVEPYYKSMETGRRMAELGKNLGIGKVALIANKVRDDDDLEVIRKFARQNDLEIAGVVPFDDAMAGAERSEMSPLDFAPNGPAVTAIQELVAAYAANGVDSRRGEANGGG